MAEKSVEKRRLSSYGTISSAEETIPIEDVEGLELQITDFVITKGDFGPFAYIHAIDPNGQKITFRTGGKLVLAALQDAKEQNAFPVQATFKKRGLAWVCE